MTATAPYLVYQFFDAADALLYVGYSSHGPERLNNHKNGSPWYGDVVRTACEYYEDADDALDREHDLITAHRPPHNVMTRRYRSRNQSVSVPIGDEEPSLSLSAAAKRIGISRKTLWHQVNAGKVEAERSGDVWLLKASVIDDYKEHRKGKPGRPPKVKEGAA